MNTPLARRTLLAYSLTDLPVMLSLFPVLVFVPRFYSSELAIPVALVGTVMLVVRLMDVVTDPLMGWISDHSRTRFGRRKPWVALAAPILMVSIYQLFLPPPDAGWEHLLVWSALLSIGTTMMLIPYYAWGAELSTDYNERSRIAGARAMAGVIGSLLAQVVPALALFFFAIGGSESVLRIVGITMLILTPLCVIITLLGTPEPPSTRPSTLPMLPGLKLMARNQAFRLLVLSFSLGQIGLTITTPLYLFFVADWLHAEDRAIYMLTLFYLCNLLSIPGWVALARRVGKHRSYLTAFVLIAIAHPCYLLLGEGQFWEMIPITILSGAAAGGFSQSMPNAMKADVIDLDTLESGENRAALFFSAWSFAQKLMGSFGNAIAMYGLAFIGYNAALGSANDPDALFGLRAMFSSLPAVFFLAGAITVWRYPITEARHQEIRTALADRALRS
ncbi:MAG: MFS transporter [Pseudomonadota bacterium]